MLKQIEGSQAVAAAVALCRPEVICAYPITPQTHIVEALSAMVKKGDLAAEFLNVESEFAALSVAIGASATGARAYTATASQGLLYMSEAVYNAAGLGLPIVMTVANRAIGAPINIWNDHSDAMSQRDAGWLVPRYDPRQVLDPAEPVSIGAMVGPEAFTEVRYLAHERMQQALQVIPAVAAEFGTQFGRDSGGLVRPYLTEDAEIVVVALGSVLGTVKDVVDELRADGMKIGVLGITSFRPFPDQAIREALNLGSVTGEDDPPSPPRIRHLVVLERALSPGTGGIVTADLRTALAGRPAPAMSTVVAGLGGRAITSKSLRALLTRAVAGELEPFSFLDLDTSLVERELARMRATRRSGPSPENILRDLGITASRIG